ncbi:MAG TPA: ATP-binding protein [Prolixibacteraceae bacterium]|nr:ATP-binding protein [Prolixibacteraceae bacterium]
MKERKIKNFVIENQIEELSSLVVKIEKLAEEWELSQELAMKINLVIEEAVSNIIFYAFNDKKKHVIKISISVEKGKLEITFRDDGIPFNPLDQKKPDINLPAEERPVGGLGIFLISQMMDEMHYSRDKNQNILILKKSI